MDKNRNHTAFLRKKLKAKPQSARLTNHLQGIIWNSDYENQTDLENFGQNQTLQNSVKS